METGRLDTFVSSGKTKRSTRKSKPSRDFIGVKFFGPEKVFFHLTGTLYGWQLEIAASSLCVWNGPPMKSSSRLLEVRARVSLCFLRRSTPSLPKNLQRMYREDP